MFGGGHIERFRGVIDDLLRLTDGLGAGDVEIAGPVIIHIGRVDMTFAGRVASLFCCAAACLRRSDSSSNVPTVMVLGGRLPAFCSS